MIRIIKIVLQRRLIGKGFVDAEIECFLALMQVYADGAAENFRQTICRSIVFTPPAPRTAELYSCSFYRDMLKKSIVKLDFC